MNITISKEEAKAFLLAYHHLHTPRSLDGKKGIMEYIHKVGAIQFDPLNIVGRSPDLLLHSRIAGYTPAMLEDLLYRERELLDGYDKEMCIYPVSYWPYFRRRREGRKHDMEQSERGKPVILHHSRIIEEIRKRGALSSKDIILDKTVDWHWAPTTLARAVLENLYHSGELVVHHREKTRKFYDLSQRVLPGDIFTKGEPLPDEDEYNEWYVHHRIGSVGLLWLKSSSAWLGTCKSTERKAAVKRLLDRKKLREIEVKGLTPAFFIRSADFPQLEKTLSAGTKKSETAIIAPLDNLMWDRDMIEALFDFYYRWEVYKPANKREYGYYVLPVLTGTSFTGRFEPGLDKKDKRLIIKNWWSETSTPMTDSIKESYTTCFKAFAAYLDAGDIEIRGKGKKTIGWLKNCL